MVKLLIAAQADVNAARSSDKVTPLMSAAYQGHKDVVEALLAAGADKTLKDGDGQTAKYWATRSGDPDIEGLF